ncbi:hypothetical protein ABZZ20_02080 [Streptomyces sp. NPDC006430]|uniref:hypothetical protein n=1 Tax=Streptomyces sp. NPDC006430 TaxID=3154299 RepID=UPI0033B2A8E4
MQLRRVLPLSLVALLASTGCVPVGPDAAPAPARGTAAPADSPDAQAAPGASPAASPRDAAPPLPRSAPLPLGELPEATPTQPPAKAARPPAARPVKAPAAPRHGHPPQPGPHRTARQPAASAGAAGGDEPCTAAEDAVPPSIMDLCIGQYGR